MSRSVTWFDSNREAIQTAQVKTVKPGHIERFSVKNTGTVVLRNLVLGSSPERGGHQACYARRKRGPYRSYIVISTLLPGRIFSFWERAPSFVEGQVAPTSVRER